MLNFEQELKKLNKQQREAVDAIEGPVMVVAGPGTGKTQVLTLRIANILEKTDTSPESVLALTFTESAAASMRKRLGEVAGVVASRVSIKTIHGFCNEVIAEFADAFPQFAGGMHVGGVEQIQIIRELLDTGDFELLRSFGDPYRSVRDILGALSSLKREGKTPEQFARIVKDEQADFDDIPDLYHEKGAHKGSMKGKYLTLQKRIERHKNVVEMYQRYQAVLAKRRQYDYDDMILSVAQVMRADKDVRFMLQEKYLYILVDEHQDTNQSQNEVIELLASFHDDPNLFVVGDAKQAIYRFQGASLENFAYFKTRFKNARVITLTNNYRSTQTILDAALGVTTADDIALKAKAGHTERPIKVVATRSPAHEPYVVASHIAARIKSGVKPEEIAILYRNNKDAEPFAAMLGKLGVPYSILAQENAFEDVAVKKLILLLEAVRDFGKDYALIPVLYLDIAKVAPLDVALLLDVAREQRVSAFQLVRDEKTLQKIVPESAEAIFTLYEKLSLWKAMSKSFSLLPMFEAVVRESGLLASVIVRPDGPAALAKITALMRELSSLIARRRSATLEEFLEHLCIMQDHHLSPSVSTMTDNSAAVSLLTAHKSKGMEFDYVYIVGATHKHWEGKRDRDFIKLPEAVFSREGSPRAAAEDEDPADSEDEYEDERNVFYVALTRVKKELVVSYPAKGDPLAGASQDSLEPTAFLSDIRSELVERVSVEKVEDEFEEHQEVVFAPEVQENKPPLREQEFLKQRFLDRGLSVSALNNYLECPNKFYFLNLVGVKEAPNPSAQAGNAAHGALKYAVERAAANEPVTKKQFLTRFAYLLSREPMREIDFTEAMKKGERALGAYFDEYHKTWDASMKPEYPVEGEFEVNAEVTIPLRGRFDRIDLLSETSVRVIDYKFKKPMSRNEIAGLTKTSDGNYYRQLTFYKLLIEEGAKQGWKMKEAALDFLEPDTKGKFKQEVFAPSDEEVADLKKEIVRVADEIMNLKFWDAKCGEKDCRYCALRGFIS